MTTINTTDEELEALMAELEAQNEELMASATPAPKPADVAEQAMAQPEPEQSAPVVELEIVVDEVKPEPEPAPVEPVPVALVSNAVSAEVVKPVAETIAVVAAIQSEIEKVAGYGGHPTGVAPKPSGLQFYVDVDQFRQDTRVTDATLDQCMIEQNGLRAYYGAEAARAEAQGARMKARFEVIEATLYDHHRKTLAASGEKTTEKMVENCVKLDPRWLKGKNMVIEAETIADINKGLVESLKDRRDMIIQLGADRRDEYKGAARVLAQQNEREDLRARAIGAVARAA